MQETHSFLELIIGGTLICRVQYSQGRNNMMDSEPQGFQVHVAFRSFYNVSIIIYNKPTNIFNR